MILYDGVESAVAYVQRDAQSTLIVADTLGTSFSACNSESHFQSNYFLQRSVFCPYYRMSVIEVARRELTVLRLGWLWVRAQTGLLGMCCGKDTRLGEGPCSLFS